MGETIGPRGAMPARPPAWVSRPARRMTLRDGRSVVLRPLAATDEELIAEFFATMTAREVFYVYALDDGAARRLARHVADDPAYRLIAVGDSGGRQSILGYMFLDWEDERPPAFGACLRDGAQSSGLGGAMMDELLASAAASGVEQVRLTVHADNWRALRLYQSRGFRIRGEFLREDQGARQYRMDVDLRALRPTLRNDLTLAARGGVGVGMAAVAIQEAIEALAVGRPLILDRPMLPGAYTVVVADLAAAAERPFETPAPPALRGGQGPGWIITLDDHHLLVGGIGVAAVEHAAQAYCALVQAQGRPLADDIGAERSAPPPTWLPFVGLHQLC